MGIIKLCPVRDPGPEKKVDPIKNERVRKTGPQELETLQFVSSYMKENVKIIRKVKIIKIICTVKIQREKYAR